jgi:hypothetical protein
LKLKPKWRAVRLIDETSQNTMIGITYPRNGGGIDFTAFDSDLIEKPAKLRLELKKKGAKLSGSKDDQEKFIGKLLCGLPSDEYVLTSKPGFRGDGFVLGSKMLGDAGKKFCWLSDPDHAGVGDVAGSMDAWTRDVAMVAAHSSFAVTAISIALASCLRTYVEERIITTKGLRPLTTEGGVINYSGHSSSGRSTLGLMANGVHGLPTAVFEWDFTRRGLDEGAASRNNLAFVIDDTEKHVETEMPLKTALRLVNQIVPKGKSKAIAGAARDKYPALTWSGFGLSSSPLPLDVIAADLKWKRSPGEQVRFIDVPVPHPDDAGIFDRLSGSTEERVEKGKQLIKDLESGIARNFGRLFPAWIDFLLIKNRALRIQKLAEGFVRRVAGDGNGYQTRMAWKFAIIYAAGKLAVDAGLLPWDKSLPWKAVTRCYKLAVADMVTDEMRAKQKIAKLAKLLDQAKRIPKVTTSASKPVKYRATTLGIQTVHKGKHLCGIREADFQRFAGSRSIAKDMLRQLHEAGALPKGQGHAGTGQLPVKIKVGGKVIKKPRFRLIRIAQLPGVPATAGALAGRTKGGGG